MISMKIKGNFNADVKGKKVQFAALEVMNLINDKGVVTESSLTDAEIVIYAYILIVGFRGNERRVVFDESVRFLSGVLNIDRGTTKKALLTLEEKKMLTKMEAGYTTPPGKKNKKYLIVMRPFLLSTDLTTGQKAFLLRIAALQEGGHLTSQVVTNKEISDRLDITTRTVSSTLKKLVDTNVSWMSVENGQVTIDYTTLKLEVAENLATRVEEHERNLSSGLQIEYNVNNHAKRKPRKKKAALILRIEALRANKYADTLIIGVIVKYINQSRLSRAEAKLAAEEKRVEDYGKS
ncbi:MAG: hypothetical protein KAH32_05015 [Chlamydiia bacterium]|nr:hypothetical protein [Chlamydiia bacterium]